LTTFTSKALRLPLWPKGPLRRREEEPQAEKPLGKSLKRATRALAAKDNTLAGVPRGFPPRAGKCSGYPAASTETMRIPVHPGTRSKSGSLAADCRPGSPLEIRVPRAPVASQFGRRLLTGIAEPPAAHYHRWHGKCISRALPHHCLGLRNKWYDGVPSFLRRITARSGTNQTPTAAYFAKEST
jgi:hypothetical protein